jgi:hypothetical protein
MQVSKLKMSLLTLALLSPMVMSQSLTTENGDWIEVPTGKRAVFVPDYMPTKQCLVTCIAPITEPVVPVDDDRSHEWDGVCESELVFGLSLPDADCECEDQLVLGPSTKPDWCAGYPY